MEGRGVNRQLTGPRARVMTGSMSVHRPVPQVQLTGGKADTADAVRLICSLRERPDRHYSVTVCLIRADHTCKNVGKRQRPLKDNAH